MNAGKDTIGGDEVWPLLKEAETVFVASGQKKVLAFTPDSDNRDDLLDKATGRTGNLRAPTVRKGKTFYVGFNTELYGRLLGAT